MRNALLPLVLAIVALAAPAARAADAALPPMNGRPDDFAPRRAGAEVDARIRITVTNEGLYRVTQPELVAAGADPMTLLGSQLRLFGGPRERAIAVSNGGLWTAEDYLVFFAEGTEGRYSDASVYWLGLGGSGKRMRERPADPLPGLPDRTTCRWEARYQADALLQDKLLPMDESFDHWFAAVLRENDSFSLTLKTELADPADPAILTVLLRGHSSAAKIDPDHRTLVTLNGSKAGRITFDGQAACTGVLTLAGSRLKPSNTLAFRQSPPGGLTLDRVMLAECRLEYSRRLRAAGGSLLFRGVTGANNYRIERLGDPAGLMLLDVTDPADPILLTGFSTAPANSITVRFGDDRPTAARYAVSRDSSLGKVAGLELAAFADLASPDRQADFLIIAPAAFVTQANRLAERRRLEGLAVEVASLPDIYNEFGYGHTDAAAIKAFIGYAYHHWQGPPPRYVLLAGNGSYDPKGNLLSQRGQKDIKSRERVPVHMGPSLHGWASLDGWYVQVDGSDRLVDLALGRLPAESPAMLGVMLDKIFEFEAVPSGNRKRREALLVADRADAALDGKRACESLLTTRLSPAGYWCTTGYSDDIREDLVRSMIFDSFRAGISLVYYFGHGSVSRWGDDILSASDMAAFSDSHAPIVLMMSCRNGAFQSPLGTRSMVELFLQRAGGASACVGTTAISFGPSAIAFAEGFTRKAATEKTRRLGDAFLGGLGDLHAYNPTTQELLYLNLFGDPTMTVNASGQ
jgi:hypothetical protein